MREIEFRGLTFDKGWVYGNLIKSEQSAWIRESDYYNFKVKYETIGQYTGLKDKNGKEIYEGDIVEWNYRGINKVVVFWDSIKAGFFITPIHCYKWRMKEPSYIRAEFLNAKNKKVIGNIYENSDLLKD